MIDLVTRAEEFAAQRASKPLVVVMPASLDDAQKRLAVPPRGARTCSRNLAETLTALTAA